MQLSLVFENSGDSIDFDVIQPDVVAYYINTLEETGSNKFYHFPPRSLYSTSADKLLLQKNFNDVNRYLIDELDIHNFEEFDLSDNYFDQQQLNRLHCDWVKCVQSTVPNIVHTLSTNPEMLTKFQIINKGVHIAESRWKLLFRNNYHEEPEYIHPPVNPFVHDITSFDHANLSIQYAGLGRHTHNKWLMYDNNVNDTDTHNFEELYGTIELSLARPVKHQPPSEYVEFCKDHNVQPYGPHVNLATLSNHEDNLARNRNIVYNNVTLANNAAEFVLK